MDFQFTDDQQALVTALQGILADHGELPQNERFSYSWFNAGLQAILTDSGFIDAARDIGPLEGALVTLETARLPVLVETAASGLIAAMVAPDEKIEGPVALVQGAMLAKAQRNLPIARTAMIDLGEDVAIVPVSADAVVPVESIYGYPYGRFRSPPELAGARVLKGGAPRLRQWRRVALALEIAGASAAAIAFTLDHVRQRHVFGRAVGSFQAVQHRLVLCHGFAEATRYLALRAAWSGSSVDADMAACHAQQGIQRLMFDMHQFHGGMGVTTEYLLHFWIYRIRALQAEAGGVYGSALDIAKTLWARPPAAKIASADTSADVA